MADAPQPEAVPEVSVVIPTKDRCALLRRTLAMVGRQQDVTLEVIVVDDGSSDGTPELLATWPDPRVRSLRHEAARGVAAARNTGLAAARGAWVGFLDDDDLWEPHKLRAQLDAAAAAGAQWAYCATLVVDETGGLIRVEPAVSASDVAETITQVNPVSSASNVIARRELLQRLDGFDTGLDHYADWDLWMRLAANGLPGVVDEPLVAYVSHATNMHRDKISTAAAEIPDLADRMQRVLGRPLDRASVLQWVAHGHGLAGDHWTAARVAARAAIHERSSTCAKAAVGHAARGVRLRREAERPVGAAPAWATPGDGS